MKQFSYDKNLVIKIDTEGMTEQQKRLIKTLNTLMKDIISTDSEEVFFKQTQEAVRNLAALVKQSHFATFVKAGDEIAYAEQALEYSFDSVQEKLYTSETNVYDN
ncbi:MAG: hypothetical protein H6621_04265 [Halobacteriovoraceae bacterium]|nr:hypothetical protein [Halobacteriovoraceae bacterium]